MKRKKKLLIALLSVACMTSAAFGLTACKNDTESGDSAIRAIYDQYVVYAETNGETVMTYEQWLESIKGEAGAKGDKGDKGDQGDKGDKGDQGVGILSIEATADGDLLVTYTDGTSAVVAMPKTYTAYAEDQNGKPIANVYLTAYYLGEDYTTVVAGYAKTNRNGVATFSFVPVKGVQYYARLTDEDKIDSGEPNTPEGYELALGTRYGLNITTVNFDDNREAVVTFKNVINSFSNAVTNKKLRSIPYSRAYDFDKNDGSVIETKDTLSLNLTANVYTYMLLDCYVSPEIPDQTADQSDEDYAKLRSAMLNSALMASTGVYEITVSGGNAVMYNYSGSIGYIPVDEYGIPSIINYATGTAPEGAEDASVYTGTNTITLDLNSYYSRATQIFGIVASSDCTVTISVTRTGDAEEPVDPEPTTMYAPTDLETYAAEAGAELNLMPINGSISVVYNVNDGYYHVGSANGPVLLAQLNNALSRVMDSAIKDLPNTVIDKTEQGSGATYGHSIFTFTVTIDGKTYKYDYTDAIAKYSQAANADGVVPVDSMMYDFLHYLANQKAIGLELMNAAEGCNWLLYCQYYSPAGGIQAAGSGTVTDPYVLISGKNLLTVSNGMAYAVFTPSSKGLYSLNSPTATIEYSGDCETVIVNGTTYICITEEDAGKAFGFWVYDEFTCTVTIGMTGDIEAVYETSGTTEENAVSVHGTQVANVMVNTAVSDGIYVSFDVLYGGDGAYKFDLGSAASARIVYNGTTYSADNPLILDCVYGTTYLLYFTSDDGNGNAVNANYIINIEKSVPSISLGSGSIEVEDMFTSVRYTFTAPETGWYTLTFPNGEQTTVTYTNSSNVETTILTGFNGLNYGVFYLIKGQKTTLTFLPATTPSSTTVSIEITTGVPQNDPIVLDEEQTIVVFSENYGYESTITVEEAGYYTFSFVGAGLANKHLNVKIGNTELDVTAGSAVDFYLEAGQNTVIITTNEGEIVGGYLTVTKKS